uniref:Uncharacterized protein n=1 Tax=Amphimedon queenslandica TaxID=400682 RepID=A0A1X7SI41_AMPQE
ACPFEFEVFTESCEGEIEILSQLSSAQHVERALASLAKSTGSVTGRVDGADESQMITYTLVSPANIATTFIENKTDRNATLKVDCSQSTNFICSFHSPVYIMTVPALSTKVAFHLVPKDPKAPFEVIFNASEMK